MRTIVSAMDTLASHAFEQRTTLQSSDFAMLADFRYELRRFALFSESEAQAHGLAPQQHQALLAIKGLAVAPTVTELSQRLCVKSHTAAELVNRLAHMGMITRQTDPRDGRRALLHLTPLAERTLESLSAVHQEQLQNIRPLLLGLLEKFSQ
ncbi:MarR family transcriptional regulator [Bordetella genomosp. 4]|uniref:MarR family transcriptional regulator n=1 Tax=Bordetella genomosp. 4 TaxID=463044 RepID=A0A261UB27_9BORD|nr:MarR family transcriptional regulator [Bordetella genomosp. 4]OZI52654.1 MarR family transcriptional regulator [Bordetella genomosp. 4]OZI59109.1 MarR family transcriptional regulator [Bordetella genomosp. 4]